MGGEVVPGETPGAGDDGVAREEDQAQRPQDAQVTSVAWSVVWIPLASDEV